MCQSQIDSVCSRTLIPSRYGSLCLLQLSLVRVLQTIYVCTWYWSRGFRLSMSISLLFRALAIPCAVNDVSHQSKRHSFTSRIESPICRQSFFFGRRLAVYLSLLCFIYRFCLCFAIVHSPRVCVCNRGLLCANSTESNVTALTELNCARAKRFQSNFFTI